MQRHHRNAASRVGLGTLIVGIALSLMAFGMSPAQAADDRAASPRASVQVGRAPLALAVASARASHQGPAQIRIHTPGGPVNSTVDWQWLYGRWQIRFNWAETRQMSRGFSYCNVIAAIIPHWSARVVVGRVRHPVGLRGLRSEPAEVRRGVRLHRSHQPHQLRQVELPHLRPGEDQ